MLEQHLRWCLCRRSKHINRVGALQQRWKRVACAGRRQSDPAIYTFKLPHHLLRACSFQTLVTPDASEAYKRHAQKKGWGANGVGGGGRPGGGGGGGGGGGRPRFGGMANVRSMDHSARPAAYMSRT